MVAPRTTQALQADQCRRVSQLRRQDRRQGRVLGPAHGHKCEPGVWPVGSAVRRLHPGRRRQSAHVRIKTDGSLICWGYNLYGQVGKAPVQAGPFEADHIGPGPFVRDRRWHFADCWGGMTSGRRRSRTWRPDSAVRLGGLRPPVEAVPTLNTVRAGSSVPLKFGLGGDKGLAVITEGFPASMQFDCASTSRRGRGGDEAGGQKQPELRRSERQLHVRLEDRQRVGGHVPRSRAEARRRDVAHGRIPVRVAKQEEIDETSRSEPAGPATGRGRRAGARRDGRGRTRRPGGREAARRR